jgi:hypothetical protein
MTLLQKPKKRYMDDEDGTLVSPCAGCADTQVG